MHRRGRATAKSEPGEELAWSGARDARRSIVDHRLDDRTEVYRIDIDPEGPRDGPSLSQARFFGRGGARSTPRSSAARSSGFGGQRRVRALGDSRSTCGSTAGVHHG